MFKERVHRLTVYTLFEDTSRETLNRSNKAFEELDNPDFFIQKRDADWRATPLDTTTPLMDEITQNALSDRLREVFIQFSELRYGYRSYGEVFVTNAYGVNVAQTGRTSDYYQADESWWKGARADGFTVGGFEYDESVAAWGMPLSVVAKDKNGTFLGVIKGVFSAANLVREEELRGERYSTSEVRLLSDVGEVIYETGAFRFYEDISDRLFFQHIGEGSGFFVSKERGQDKLFAYTRSQGFRNYAGLGWVLLISHDIDEVFAPVRALRNLLLGATGGLIVVIGILAIILSRSISRPIVRLTQTAGNIANGDLKQRVTVRSKDEIGQLGSSFNFMADTLQASYARLEEQVEELKELDRLKDAFLNTATHELKTPLIPVKSQTQLLLREDYGPLNENQRKAVQMISRNETHLENLVDDLVNIAKIRSGKLDVHLRNTDLTEIIANTVLDMEEPAREKGLVLTLQPTPKLPEFPLDRKFITQVTGNLLSNALKFTPEGGKVMVEVSSRSEPSVNGEKAPVEAVVCVKDTGIGMSKEVLRKLFTPFFQADSDVSRRYRGSGLGLSICKGIVEAHGGTIWAESDGEGKGTTVVFVLPTKNSG